MGGCIRLNQVEPDNDQTIGFGDMFYQNPRLGNNVYTPGRTGIELIPDPDPPGGMNNGHVGFRGTLTKAGNFRYLLYVHNNLRYQDWSVVNITVLP